MDNKPHFISTFIELYKSFPCLWKVKDYCYHNKRLKESSYDTLLTYYRTTIPSATIDTVKRKINNLRSSFRKELKKVKTQKSGSSADDIYTSNLWYFDLLMFTADQEIPRTSISSDRNEEIDQNETFCEDDASISSPSTASYSPLPTFSPRPPHSPLPSDSQQSSSQSVLSTVSVSTNKLPANKRKSTLINEAYKALKEDDEYDGIGLNVACKLRRMNDEQKLYAELLINKVILYGIRNRLQEDTNITGLVATSSQSQNRHLNLSPNLLQTSPTSNAEYKPIILPNASRSIRLPSMDTGTSETVTLDELSPFVIFRNNQ